MSHCAVSVPTHYTAPCSWECMEVHVCVLAACVCHCFCASCRPSRRVWSGATASVLTRLCASVQGLHCEGSRPTRWWGRDSGLGTMQVPWVARGGSRLCFCRVVLRDAVERKLRGTHRLYYVKTSSYGMNALGLCLSIHRTALSALARSDSRFTSESTLSAGHPPTLVWRHEVESVICVSDRLTQGSAF